MNLSYIVRDMIPHLENVNEVCFIWNDSTKSWKDVTKTSSNRMCLHSVGGRYMAHIHPLRNISHPTGTEETNYYPSCPDILLPIIQPVVTDNYILTPIGLFIAKFELTDYAPMDEREIIKIFCSTQPNQSYKSDITSLDEIFFPIHNLTSGMIPGTSLQSIAASMNDSLIALVNSLCHSISLYISLKLKSWGFPIDNQFTLEFIDINTLVHGIRSKVNVKSKIAGPSKRKPKQLN